jgi:Rps23 Pro-64 3,4-dihydroxylase Tpa1-like proline 4-hydroxylase
MSEGNQYKLIPAFYFSKNAILQNVEDLHQQFLAAKPFPHLIIEKFLPDDLAKMVAQEFPGPDDIEWRLAGPGDVKHTGNKYVEKLSMSNEGNFPPLIRHIMNQFYSGTFIEFIEQVTGYKNMVADPTFFGCGMHSTGPGGRLMVHADASRHQNPKLQQVINLIYYVTPDWKDEYNGQLELWDEQLKACVTRIKPTFNSAVIFYTGTKSYHGHPVPLACPFGMRRNSLACYYYTTDRVFDESYEGYRNFVDWKRTTDLDQQVSIVHRAKTLVRRYAPRIVTNQIASVVRRLKKARRK